MFTLLPCSHRIEAAHSCSLCFPGATERLSIQPLAVFIFLALCTPSHMSRENEAPNTSTLHFPNTQQRLELRFTFYCCWQNRVLPATWPETLGCINCLLQKHTPLYTLDTEEIKTADVLLCKDKLICPRNGMRAADLIKSTVRSSRNINPSSRPPPASCQCTNAQAACQFAAAGKDRY